MGRTVGAMTRSFVVRTYLIKNQCDLRSYVPNQCFLPFFPTGLCYERCHENQRVCIRLLRRACHLKNNKKLHLTNRLKYIRIFFIEILLYFPLIFL